jgi:hypothetical protein
VGDVEAVMDRSRPLILDPLAGHTDTLKRIDEPNMRETVKERAVLDGGFILCRHGTELFRENDAARRASEERSPAVVLENEEL